VPPASALILPPHRKGGMNFSLHRTFGTLGSGVDIQAAYIPSKHVGLITIYSNTIPKWF